MLFTPVLCGRAPFPLFEQAVQVCTLDIQIVRDHLDIDRLGVIVFNITAWMTVSSDRKEAVAGWYRTLNGVNMPYTRLRLQGLDPEAEYEVEVRGSCVRSMSSGTQAFRIGTRCGDELMNLGLITSDASSGQIENVESCDFDSRIYILKAK